MNTRASFVAVAGVAAALLAHAGKPPAANGGAAPSFRGHARADVLLVAGKKGLVATSADRKWSATLAPGGIDQAALDPTLELVWITQGDRLHVIDLRDAKAKPVLIAKGFPTLRNFRVVRGGDDSHAAASHAMAVVEIVLRWHESPSMEGISGDDDERATVEAEAKKVQIVGAKWLVAQLPREAVEVPAARRPAADPSFKLPEGVGKCSGETGQEGMCGTGVEFGDTGFRLVVQRLDCGSFICQTSCVLVDDKGRIASPLDTTAWSAKVPTPAACHPYHFDRAGKHYATGDGLCTVSGPCVKLDGDALGWLVPGVRIGPN